MSNTTTRRIGIPWLQALFGTVSVPEEVLQEVVGRNFRGEATIAIAIADAVTTGWLLPMGPAAVDPALPDLDSTRVRPPASGWPLPRTSQRCC